MKKKFQLPIIFLPLSYIHIKFPVICIHVLCYFSLEGYIKIYIYIIGVKINMIVNHGVLVKVGVDSEMNTKFCCCRLNDTCLIVSKMLHANNTRKKTPPPPP